MLHLRRRYSIYILAVNGIFGSKSILWALVIDSTRSHITGHIVGGTVPGNLSSIIHVTPRTYVPYPPLIWPPCPPPSPDCGCRSLTGHADSALLNEWETWSIYAHVPYIEKLFFCTSKSKGYKQTFSGFGITCICAFVGMCVVFGFVSVCFLWYTLWHKCMQYWCPNL